MKLSDAVNITDQEEADEYFEEYVSVIMRAQACTRIEAEGIVRKNIGYFAGYYSQEDRARVERLFKCEHPIFGKLEPTIQEAIDAGMHLAERGPTYARDKFMNKRDETK